MSDIKVEYLVKELSARVDELEASNKALQRVLAATFSSLSSDSVQKVKQSLLEWSELSEKSVAASASDAHSFQKTLKEIEIVVGALK
ncbi:hypothetical protein MUA04_01010 [Enterobacteriaceae bacterium H11S18]|uniref:hypothetical protein n=1 Tax=Dryocola clanedunensis TaxID=2925396 RepID=UPI0022F116A8|nr:hypothetical protein [Dryocola clanedunensis]MCT4708815.1 hypothetical protein [Dryocola clanedunensis]